MSAARVHAYEQIINIPGRDHTGRSAARLWPVSRRCSSAFSFCAVKSGRRPAGGVRGRRRERDATLGTREDSSAAHGQLRRHLAACCPRVNELRTLTASAFACVAYTPTRGSVTCTHAGAFYISSGGRWLTNLSIKSIKTQLIVNSTMKKMLN